jgi:flagellar hook assembly protein FlgD
LSEPENVTIRIYDSTDKLVRLIEKHFDEPGDFSVEWDGRDNENEELLKGDYTFQLEIGSSLSELKTISLNHS